MTEKQINHLLDNATYTVDEHNDELFLVDFSKVKLASISVTAKTKSEARAQAAKWFEDDVAKNTAARWQDTPKAEKKKSDN